MNKKELIETINLSYQAVNESIVGPILANRETNTYNTLAINVFYSVVSKLIPPNIDTMKIKEVSGEDWKSS